jgi:hypothetical protein
MLVARRFVRGLLNNGITALKQRFDRGDLCETVNPQYPGFSNAAQHLIAGYCGFKCNRLHGILQEGLIEFPWPPAPLS